MLHLTKLAVGVRDIDHLRELQAERAERSPPLRHRTRNFPRRREEVVDGGSIYWIIKGAIRARQPIVAIGPAVGRSGRPRCGLTIAFPPVATLPLPRGAIQGWRYLESADAPPDLTRAGAGAAKLPPAMADELQRLGLL